MDQRIHWNNMVLDPVGNSNLPDCLLPSNGDTNMSYINMDGPESAHMSIWSPGGPSSGESGIQGGHSGTKMEPEWTTSLTIDAGGSTRTEERQLEAPNMLSLENVNINLNSDHAANDHSFSHDTNTGAFHQNSYQNAGRGGIISQVVDTGISSHPYNPSLLVPEHFSLSSGASNACGNSSMGAAFLSEDGDGRPEGAPNGRRISCKRKNIEGGAGPSSVNGSSSSVYQHESSSLPSLTACHNVTTSVSMFSLPEDIPAPLQLDQRSGAIMMGLALDSYPSSTITENAESSQRNFRMRMNPAHQHDTPPPNLWLPENGNRHRSIRSPHQPPNLLVPISQPLVSGPVVQGAPSQSHPQFSFIPSWLQSVHPALWNGPSSSRIGSTLSSASSAERLSASRGETNSRSIMRNGIPDYSLFVPTGNVNQLTRDPANWNLSNGSMNMSANIASTSHSQAGTSSVVHPSVGPTWVPHHNPPMEHPLSLSDVRQSLFPSGLPESGSQSSNATLQHADHPVNSQDAGHRSLAGFRGNPQPLRRSAHLMDRRNEGVPGIPLSIRNLAAREGRSRMISEIRNVLDLMRRGENLRFEDVFVLDQSMFPGGADLHDRHRDMRLDVDNMSYEELLALEERIGNVSTGLSEETILKLLKWQKYALPIVMEVTETEPCCICQEEYTDGDELGTLDCGHDFHTACIKQWLMHKNLCPICKTTGLKT